MARVDVGDVDVGDSPLMPNFATSGRQPRGATPPWEIRRGRPGRDSSPRSTSIDGGPGYDVIAGHICGGYRGRSALDNFRRRRESAGSHIRSAALVLIRHPACWYDALA